MKASIHLLMILFMFTTLSSQSQQRANVIHNGTGQYEPKDRHVVLTGDFTEVSPLDTVWVTPPEEDFWVITTAPADYDNDGDMDIAVLGYYFY